MTDRQQGEVFEALLDHKYNRVRERSYLALDVPTFEEARAWMELFGSAVSGYKVGLQLFDSDGPRVLEELQRRNKRVFLDLKLHDIPNTVAGALRVLCDYDVEMVNVHATGGRQMMESAREVVNQSKYRPLLIAVTMLTSLGTKDLLELGFQASAEDLVVKLALLAADCGLDGVVASGAELAAIRQHLPEPFEIVVPGTRLPGTRQHDQVRTLSPGLALRAGATRLVLGRALTANPDPLPALQQVWDDMVRSANESNG